jgi:hypothetical protein
LVVLKFLLLGNFQPLRGFLYGFIDFLRGKMGGLKTNRC